MFIEVSSNFQKCFKHKMERSGVIYIFLIALMVATIDCCKKKQKEKGPLTKLVYQYRHGTASREEMLKTFASLSPEDKEYVFLHVDVTIAEELLSTVPGIMEQVCSVVSSNKSSIN